MVYNGADGDYVIIETFAGEVTQILGDACCPGQSRLCTTGGIHLPLLFGTRQTG